MPSELSAIERKWFAIAPDGSESDVTLRVGMPVHEVDGEWSVLVSLGPIDGEPRKVFGLDSWQAVGLGMRFIAARVQDFSERGWQFFWERGGERAAWEE